MVYHTSSRHTAAFVFRAPLLFLLLAKARYARYARGSGYVARLISSPQQADALLRAYGVSGAPECRMPPYAPYHHIRPSIMGIWLLYATYVDNNTC